MEVKFTKMQAYGNDYVYVDAIHQQIDDPNDLARKVANRHFGIGSDGLVMICQSTKADFRMRMFNPDGSEGEMCGNALRSLSKFVYFHGLTTKEDLLIETLGGMQQVHLNVENGNVTNISANIGKPGLQSTMVPVHTKLEQFIDQKIEVLDRTFYASSISWGNPHTVIFMDNVADFAVEKYGPAIEFMTDIFPKKTNVTFAQIVDENNIKIREWERGTGETIGCGTGCCSAVVVGNLLGKCARSVDVHQIGGTLHVDFEEDDRVRMTGPSHVVYEGVYLYETE